MLSSMNARIGQEGEEMPFTWLARMNSARLLNRAKTPAGKAEKHFLLISDSDLPNLDKSALASRADIMTPLSST